ncbi:D-alanyl-D-alanine carboxypeptidase/D-alanyl-D-alanine endopeptidase [Tautonia marina]|uniref:D-alanyl-D-alanine carboxypeptidase/D-alanyl-D-alanine endopeptidase n=1 Tax=Tautonia marina TaxID=2653855 RepID=UPI001260517E|nr:D-alanyl-D-alanine carboxypeptidase/D-alanyl-D-alanine-endopeptidase [Tautonia marina]
MRRNRGAWGAWIALLLATPVMAGPDATADRVRKILATPGFEIGHWGVLVVDRASGEVVFEHQADHLFIPAEVGQLFASAAVLEGLGGDYRFQTPIHRLGEVGPDGTLDGDLILVAVGDPSLGGRTSPRDGSLLYRDVDHTRAGTTQGAMLVEADPLAGLDHLAREVKAAGIVAVTGEVIIDDRLFPETPVEGGAPSKVSSIAVNDNLIDVVITPASEPGMPAEINTVPPSRYYATEARVDTVVEGEAPRIELRREGTRRFSIRGQVPVGHPPIVQVYEVEHPADFARAALIEQLRGRGVRVEASPLGDNPSDRLPTRVEVDSLPRVALYMSPPLREYVRVTLKVGHHAHAALLPLLLSSADEPRSLTNGLRRQGTIFQQLGLPGEGISLSSGIGTHRTDRVSPRAVVALLRAMQGRPAAQAFETALPVIGREGTALDIVAAESPARGHGRAHAGTAWTVDETTGKPFLLSKGLAGYLETASGRDLAFAVFVNHVPTSGETAERGVTNLSASRVLGALCEAFYDDQSPQPRSAAVPQFPLQPPGAIPPSREHASNAPDPQADTIEGIGRIGRSR